MSPPDGSRKAEILVEVSRNDCVLWCVCLEREKVYYIIIIGLTWGGRVIVSFESLKVRGSCWKVCIFANGFGNI
jgi:hypothetical protein